MVCFQKRDKIGYLPSKMKWPSSTITAKTLYLNHHVSTTQYFYSDCGLLLPRMPDALIDLILIDFMRFHSQLPEKQ